MAAWIDMISDEDASKELKEVLDLARTPHGTVDNVMRVHSLRPNTMKVTSLYTVQPCMMMQIQFQCGFKRL